MAKKHESWPAAAKRLGYPAANPARSVSGSDLRGECPRCLGGANSVENLPAHMIEQHSRTFWGKRTNNPPSHEAGGNG